MLILLGLISCLLVVILLAYVMYKCAISVKFDLLAWGLFILGVLMGVYLVGVIAVVLYGIL